MSRVYQRLNEEILRGSNGEDLPERRICKLCTKLFAIERESSNRIVELTVEPHGNTAVVPMLSSA